ncbi:exopolyphosphatase / guanosine-5'-triphosphate,3'-diphosphate pyrophosphatase [Neorhodopirellula lusitana]|uniref:Exopolyphosphatase / guanosine-5'-triphosphate,3'-diphosphate pyrophosphatase n=1 Tax=Neorhodopirellula lusitana TaxID=445327 RepID=A0ABY1QEZ4_9BACT|nr:Ppx/GppA phosphatase family protein [Neorhodopirellula lusitana]SMP69445.1 exopolyphosphatase / guanosine-5'-triphosphate,3'-diphosphate pyrophosphatase [Neorhodopirellula lusitana]
MNASTSEQSFSEITNVPPGPARTAPRTVAVIDIGAISIRMSIAEIHPDGKVRTLESLLQPVDLGRDAFESRRLSRKGIERAAAVLKRFRRILDEYGVHDANDIRVVATTAVREATNRIAFVDRVFVATGLDVEPIDEAEVNRITYMSITPKLLARAETAESKSVVLEVGSGSTELLIIRGGNVLHSDTFRLGSLRLAQSIDASGVQGPRWRQLLETHIKRFVVRIAEDLKADAPLELVLLGGDIRFAAHRLVEDWDEHALTKLSVEKLEKLTSKVLDMGEDGIVEKFGATFVEAETLAPALLSYTLFAKHFELEHVFVSGGTLRDGLLADMEQSGNWTSEFRQQIIRSAVSLGRKFAVDQSHARAVAELTRLVFEQLSEEHQLDPRHEVLLYVAALLHEVGLYVSVHSNHKHAYYLIRNSELFGLSRQELQLVALVARYHRRASPQTGHEGYSSLDRKDRVAVTKMAAMLRIAIALDDTRSGRIREVVCTREEKRMVISVPGVNDVSLEQLALGNASSLFRDIFGVPILLRAGKSAV